MENNDIINEFHKLYYSSAVWKQTFWLGVQTFKCPLDLWNFQEIIFEIKPDIIIESGTAKGGTTLFLANICDLVKKGKVISIDSSISERPSHNRIIYITEDSTSERTKAKIESLINKEDVVLVDLDSDHSEKNVLKELTLYSRFVTKGSYLIVEDTNISSSIHPDLLPGPAEAVGKFLETNKNFTVDRCREKFFLTFNPCGYLKRIE